MPQGFDSRAFSLAAGISWGLGVLLLGLGSNVFPGWQVAVEWLNTFYVGYSSSVAGSLIGAVYGFVDVFVGLYFFLWLYEYLKGRV